MMMELAEIDDTIEEEYRKKKNMVQIPWQCLHWVAAPRKQSCKGIYKILNSKDVGMPWKTRKGYVLKRDQSIVTKKFNHMRIKGPPAGNYVTGDPRESSVIRDVIPSAGMSETQGSRQKIL